MHPTLVKIGSFEIRSYGFMLALSFLIGIYLATRRAKKIGIDPNGVMDLSVIIIISSIVGARLLYILPHLDEFRGRWTDTFNPFQSDGQIGIAGLTLLGGVILAFVNSLIYLKWKKLPFLKFADAMLPSVALGEALTRIGCFLNGCCFGLPCDHAHFCVSFPPDSAAGSFFPGTPLIPAQLYSSFYALSMFFLMLWLGHKLKYQGVQVHLFLILYGIGRFVIDFFRYYEDAMIILTVAGKGISLNQGISLIFIVIGTILMIVSLQRRKSGRPTTT